MSKSSKDLTDAFSDQYQLISNERTNQCVTQTMALLPAQLREIYLKLRPFKQKSTQRQPNQKQFKVQALSTQARDNSKNEKCDYLLGQSKITQFKTPARVTEKDLLELPAYAYSDYVLLDMMKRPKTVNPAESDYNISIAKQRRDFWIKEMEAHSEKLLKIMNGK